MLAVVATLILITSSTAAVGESAVGGNVQVAQDIYAGAPYSEYSAESRAQEEFTVAIGEVLDRYPRDVIDHYWDGKAGVLVVKPESALAVRIHAIKSAVKVLASSSTSVPVSQRAEIESEVLDEVDMTGTAGVSARFDSTTNSVVITVWSDDKSTTARSPAESAVLNGIAQKWSVGLRYEVRPAAEAPRTEADTRGGEAYQGCTGGFMGTRGSAYGIITAAHCTAKPAKYNGDTTGATYVAPGNRDLRFTALSGGTPRNRIKIGASSFRTITQTGVVSSGITLYKYGKESGLGHSVVESYVGCHTYPDQKKWCNLWRVKDQVTTVGDSGGPWFVNNRAYGIHHASSANGSLLTPIAYVATISGTVKVKTS